MRLNTQKKRKTKNGKTWFIAAAIALLTIFSTTFLLQSHALKKCDTSKHELDECGCPMDTELIGKKNVILIDASDKVPVSKFKDIEEIINSFTKPSQTLDWLHKSKRVDKTSIYVLNVNSPVEMLTSPLQMRRIGYSPSIQVATNCPLVNMSGRLKPPTLAILLMSKH